MRAILFDLDNTLIDRDAAMLRWAQQWPVDERVRRQALKLDQGGQGDREAFTVFLAKATGRTWSASQIALEVARRVHPRPELVPMLEVLARRYVLAVVSNGGMAPQREKLRRSGLADFFSVIVISEEVGYAKPSRKIFAAALGQLACAARESLFVGDSPRCDVRGAAAVGMRTCWLRTRTDGAADEPADFIVSDLRELGGVIQRWETLAV